MSQKAKSATSQHGKLVLCTVKGCHCKTGDDGMIHVEDNGRCGFMPKDWAILLVAAPELLRQLDGIAAALEEGNETVIIEPGSVKARAIHDAITQASGRKS